MGPLLPDLPPDAGAYRTEPIVRNGMPAMRVERVERQMMKSAERSLVPLDDPSVALLAEPSREPKIPKHFAVARAEYRKSEYGVGPKKAKTQKGMRAEHKATEVVLSEGQVATESKKPEPPEKPDEHLLKLPTFLEASKLSEEFSVVQRSVYFHNKPPAPHYAPLRA